VASGPVAWWVGPVNGLMTPAARRGRCRPESSFRALQARAPRRTGLPEPADPQFLQVIHPLDARAPEECIFALAHHMAYHARARPYSQGHPRRLPRPVSLGHPRPRSSSARRAWANGRSSQARWSASP
jgi:hypothetical protein